LDDLQIALKPALGAAFSDSSKIFCQEMTRFHDTDTIVAGSVENENIFVMETTADGSSVVRQYKEDIYGLNAEEILLSPYFNLATTRAANFAGELKALSLKAGRGDLDAALEFMQRLASPNAAVNGKPKGKTASLPKNGKKKTSSKKKPLRSKP
jgi:hypothetical protein